MLAFGIAVGIFGVGAGAGSEESLPVPTASVKPVISGTQEVGQSLTTTNGTWDDKGVPITNYTYQWYRDGVAVSGATLQGYDLVNEDEGTDITVRVGAVTFNGTGYSFSNPVGPIAPEPPEPVLEAPTNTGLPTISGTATEGETLFVSTGSWDDGGAEITDYDYQWLRDGEIIDNEVADEYTLTDEDVGSLISVEVTATNSVGFGVAETAAVGEVQSDVPVNLTLPLITGTAREDETLTVSNGTWDAAGGAPISGYAYQWIVDGNEVPGETTSTYVPVGADVGLRVSCRVTATNSLGSTMALSLETPAVIAAPNEPAIITAPVVTGELKEDETLSCSQGVWDDGGAAISGYTYAWFADDVSLGVTAASLSLTSSHVGKIIRCEVTATNVAGSVTATSDPMGPVLADVLPPSYIVKPAYSGSLRAGQSRTMSAGTWNNYGSPETVTYAWYNVTDSVYIDGETSDTITWPLELVGKKCRGEVTATNDGGSTTVILTTSTVQAGLVPLNTSIPVISGDPFVGETLTVTDGTWDPRDFPITSYTYQWVHTSNTPISGETSNTFEIEEEHIGLRLRCQVTAHNAAGSKLANSGLTVKVQAELTPPVNDVSPSISGTAKRGQTLTASPGTWSGNPSEMTYVYTWLRDNVVISGASGSTYVLKLADVGKKISVNVVANNGQTGSATSAQTGTVEPGDMPVNDTPPEISGTVRETYTVTCSQGTWTVDPANPVIAYQYQWYIDDVAVPGATSTSLIVPVGSAGKILHAVVTAHTDQGNVSQASDDSDIIIPEVIPPTNSVEPTVSVYISDASPYIFNDDTLSVAVGTWDNGGGVITYSYQWKADGANISGATSATFVITADQIGNDITCDVTATNSAGSLTVGSDNSLGPVYDKDELRPETTDYIEAMTTPPDSSLADDIDTLIRTLVLTGSWYKLDIFALHAVHDEQAARINARDVAEVATHSGTLNFVAGSGFQGNASQFLEWGKSVDAYNHFSQTSALIGAFALDNVTTGATTGRLLGAELTNHIRMIPRAGASVSNFNLNTTTTLSGAGGYADQRGLNGVIRRGGSDVVIKYRKIDMWSGTQSSQGAWNTAGKLQTLAVQDGAGSSLVAATLFGGQLDDSEWNALSDALDTFVIAQGNTLPPSPDVDAKAYLDAIAGSSPSGTFSDALTVFVKALKDAGVWSKLDIIGVYAGPSEVAARTNVKNPAQVATKVGTVTTTPYSGLSTSGSGNNYINWGDWSPEQDNHTLAAWTLTERAATNAKGTMGGGVNQYFGSRNLRTFSGAATADSVTVGSSAGLSGMRRGSSSEYYGVRDKTHTLHSRAISGSWVVPRTIVTNGGYLSGGTTLINPTDDRIALVFMGPYLTSTEWDAMYDASNAFLTAIGAH